MYQDEGRTERVVRQSRALREDVRGLAREVGEATKEMREKVNLTRAVREHPFRAVGIAVGVGYLLGGGLFTPLTGRILRVGARAMLVPFIKGQVETLVGEVAGQGRS